MPAKAKVTKEMIVDAAFAIAREAGVENINARTVLMVGFPQKKFLMACSSPPSARESERKFPARS